MSSSTAGSSGVDGGGGAAPGTLAHPGLPHPGPGVAMIVVVIAVAVLMVAIVNGGEQVVVVVK